MDATKKTLAKVSDLLKQVVGTQKHTAMTTDEFVAHAISEVTKAQSEPHAQSRKRLIALQKAVMQFEGGGDMKVVVFQEDTTSLEEQTEKTIPAGSVSSGTSSGSTFSNTGDLAKRIQEITDLVAQIGKAGEEDEEAAKAGKKDPEEEDPAKKAAAKDPDMKDPEEKAKTEKAWPDDMNDPAFVKDGVTKRDLDWGEDAAPKGKK